MKKYYANTYLYCFSDDEQKYEYKQSNDDYKIYIAAPTIPAVLENTRYYKCAPYYSAATPSLYPPELHRQSKSCHHALENNSRNTTWYKYFFKCFR